MHTYAGDIKSANDCISCLNVNNIGLLLKMVHNAYYRREFIPEDKKHKQRKTNRTVAKKLTSEEKVLKIVSKINTSVGLIDSSLSSKGKKVRKSTKKTQTATSEEETTSADGGDNIEDEVLFVKEESGKSRDIPKIGTVQTVSLITK